MKRLFLVVLPIGFGLFSAAGEGAEFCVEMARANLFNTRLLETAQTSSSQLFSQPCSAKEEYRASGDSRSFRLKVGMLSTQFGMDKDQMMAQSEGCDRLGAVKNRINQVELWTDDCESALTRGGERVTQS